MIREIVKMAFEGMTEPEKETKICDNHVPKDGTYKLIKITEDGFEPIKSFDIRRNKKENIIEGSDNSDYRYVKALDYYSQLLEMNKPVGTKTIHSNNCMAMAVKKSTILDNSLTDKVLDDYYSALKNPEKKHNAKSKSRILYEKVEQEYGKPDCELIDRIHDYVSKENIWGEIDPKKKGEYIKVFFVFGNEEETKAFYRRESRRYVMPNIFNSNDYNIAIGDIVLGVSNDNMGMNSKKPFLSNRTKKVEYPYMISATEAMDQKLFFDYLMGCVSKGETNIYINNNGDEYPVKGYKNSELPDGHVDGYFLKLKKGKNEVEIQRMDVVSDFNSNLEKSFKLKNYREVVSDNKKEDYYKDYNQLSDIRNLMSDFLFSGRLVNNFFTDIKDISMDGIFDNTMRRIFSENRDSLFSWFCLGEREQAINRFDRFSLEIIENTILNGRNRKANEQLNFRWSLLEYFDSERRIGEKMKKASELLREHINFSNEKTWDFENDEEYAYAVGQMVGYFNSISKSGKKSSEIINPFLSARSSKAISLYISRLYKKYNYAISSKPSTRFNQMNSHVVQYCPKEIMREYIMAGFTGTSLIYEKKNSEVEESEEI